MKQLEDALQRPIRDLRISVVDTCNYRCPYCMPEDQFPSGHKFLTNSERLSFHQITKIANQFIQIGVKKIRLTGGEPLLRKNIHHLIGSLSALPGIEDLALTTNGVLLEKKLPFLINSGLKRITISVDAIDEHIYRKMNGNRGSVLPVLKAIKAALKTQLVVKINCVVQKNINESQIIPLLNYFRGSKAIIRFIEFMDVGNINNWKSNAVTSGKEILNIIDQHYNFHPISANYHGEVSQRYLLNDQSMEFGLITSVSQPFCQSCGRIRLSTNGHLYTCLFSHKGYDIRPFLQKGATESDFQKYIQSIWENRADQYSEKRNQQIRPSNKSKIEMYVIGG